MFATAVHAEHFFPEADIEELQIKTIFAQGARVMMKDRSGTEHEMGLGDTVGFEEAQIVEIEKTAVIVDRVDYETCIPAVFAVGKSPAQ